MQVETVLVKRDLDRFVEQEESQGDYHQLGKQPKDGPEATKEQRTEVLDAVRLVVSPVFKAAG